MKTVRSLLVIALLIVGSASCDAASMFEGCVPSEVSDCGILPQ